MQILAALLKDEPVKDLVQSAHLLPSTAADTINEALLEEIGDSILECDQDRLVRVEDYRDEILEVLEGRI